jgi:hypothetical protein
VAEAGIPRDIRDFLGQYISSIEQLEILLFLYRHPGRVCDVAAIAQHLGLTEPVAAKGLDELKRSGLIQAVGEPSQYQAVLDKDAQMQLVQRLGQVYSERRVTIINLIFSRHLDRIRAFADSFKLTKRDPDG